MPQALSAKAFPAKTGGGEGYFEKFYFPEEVDTGNGQNILLASPNANAESEAFGLAVRKERTRSPTGRTKMCVPTLQALKG